MRSQASLEFFIIVSLVLLMLYPLWITLFSSVTGQQEELRVSYARTAVERVRQAADLVYVQGEPAQVSVRVYIPEGVENYTLSGEVIELNVRNRAGITDIVAFSNGNMTGELPTTAGYHTLRIKAVGGLVNVTR